MPSNASLNRRVGSLRKEVEELRQALVAINQRLDAFVAPSEPAPSCSSAFEVDKPVQKQETIEYNFDNYGPDFIQDYMPSYIRDEQVKGKLVIISFQQNYRHRVSSPNDLDIAEGTTRSFQNAVSSVNELLIDMQGVGEILLILQPGDSGSLVFTAGAWRKMQC